MKKLIIIIAVLLIMGCGKITVLEVKVVDDNYRVVYNKENFSLYNGQTSQVNRCDFKTTLGVNNFLNEVADKDLSQWRVQ